MHESAVPAGTINETVKGFQRLVRDKRDRDIFDRELVRPRSGSSDAATIHRSGTQGSAKLQPNRRPFRARRVKQGEILEAMRSECSHFHQFMVIGGWIGLQLARADGERLLLAG